MSYSLYSAQQEIHAATGLAPSVPQPRPEPGPSASATVFSQGSEGTSSSMQGEIVKAVATLLQQSQQVCYTHTGQRYTHRHIVQINHSGTTPKD